MLCMVSRKSAPALGFQEIVILAIMETLAMHIREGERGRVRKKEIAVSVCAGQCQIYIYIITGRSTKKLDGKYLKI